MRGKWLQKSCLPTDLSISSAQVATVLYVYLTQNAASLWVDFSKHLTDFMQISSWLKHKLASRKLLLRLITKGAWSVHLERVSLGVCVLVGWSSESIVTGPVASPQAPSHSMKPASLNWTIKHLHIVTSPQARPVDSESTPGRVNENTGQRELRWIVNSSPGLSKGRRLPAKAAVTLIMTGVCCALTGLFERAQPRCDLGLSG